MVKFAMRYGNPSTNSVPEKMQVAGCTKILLVPLYPQNSATTTATANDVVRTTPAYFEDPKYIETLGNSIRDGVAALDFEPNVVITGYHGMPVTYLQRGDVYHFQCYKTTRLAGGRISGLAYGQADGDVPVALRPGPMARTLYR